MGCARNMTDMRGRLMQVLYKLLSSLCAEASCDQAGPWHEPQQARRGRAVPHGRARQHAHVPHAHLAVRRR